LTHREKRGIDTHTHTERERERQRERERRGRTEVTLQRSRTTESLDTVSVAPVEPPLTLVLLLTQRKYKC